MTQTTVAKLEAANRPLRLNEVYAIAEILGEPVESLLPDVAQLGGTSPLVTALNEVRALHADIAQMEERLSLLRATRAGMTADIEVLEDRLTAKITALQAATALLEELGGHHGVEEEAP